MWRCAVPDAGPLAGLTMAVKDIFHIAGHRTGFGNPDWLRTHPPATETADGRAATARCRRRHDRQAPTPTSSPTRLSGENVHYGTPLNHGVCRIACRAARPAVRWLRWPPGSSILRSAPTAAARCACRRAIAASSACGRPTGASRSTARCRLRRASTWRDGSRATRTYSVGWASVLLGERREPAVPRRLLLAEDAFAVVDQPVAEALRGAVAPVGGAFCARGGDHRQPATGSTAGWTCFASCKAPRSGRTTVNGSSTASRASAPPSAIAAGPRSSSRAPTSRPPRRGQPAYRAAHRCADRRG